MESQEDIFTGLRPVLMNLARRMLGRESEAEDIVQEAYLRWQQASQGVRSPKAFLTTVVTRLCLNHLRLARVRLEHGDASMLLENVSSDSRDPSEHAELADALSEAFTTVLGRLSATERVVFLLRESFDFDYGDIASIVERSEDNCRQILKRARDRITAPKPATPAVPEENRRVVSEFLHAAETGEIDGLLKLLSAEASLARDGGDLYKPSPPLIRDRVLLRQTLGDALAELRKVSAGFACFSVGQDYALVSRSGRSVKGAILLRIAQNRVSALRLVTCPALLRQLQILMSLSLEENLQEKSNNN